MADVRVMGVDGVRARWLGAVLDLDPDGEQPAVATWLLGSAADVLGALRPVEGSPPVVACGIDVPVGLVREGLRAAEVQARALLAGGTGRGTGGGTGGGTTSSLFATAPQPAFAVARRLGGTRASRPEADAASRAAGAGGVSTQAWGLADKVLEVEDAVRALGPAGDGVVEVHPETSFALMARDLRLPAPAGKRTAAGVAGRVRLLGRALPSLDVVEALAGVPTGRGADAVVAVDDALDALAAACSALRHAFGHARVLGAGADAVWSDGSPAPGRAVLVV